MIFLWAFWFVVLIGVGWLILQRVRAARGANPIEIIKGRYARGEIDAETFHRMLTDLHQAHAGVKS